MNEHGAARMTAGRLREAIMTAGQLREAIATVPDGDPVMLVVGVGDAVRAGWLRAVRPDSGSRTVDLVTNPTDGG